MSCCAITKPGMSKLNQFLLDFQHSCSVVVLLTHSQPQRHREHAGGTEKMVALKDVFKNDFKIGAALNRHQIFENDVRGAEIVKTHFNSITPENVLKWALVHPERPRYDFEAPDRFVKFGEK